MSSIPIYNEGAHVRQGGSDESESAARAGVSGLSVSGVSWAAILAGAAAAAALSLVLLLIGTGLGLSLASPWSNDGVDAAEVGVSTIAWLTFTQLAASALGGYLAGRLRVKWVAVHTDEVFFRDTAHGLLTWAIATLATATMLAVSVSAIIGGGIQAVSAAGGAAGGAATAAASASDTLESGNLSYSIDSLFRKNPATPESGAPADTIVVARIFLRSLQANEMTAEDRNYIAQQVVQHTGISQAEAEQRVGTVFTQLVAAKQTAKQAADEARKAAAVASLWMAFALFVGAFCASYAATIGGRQRDNLKPIP